MSQIISPLETKFEVNTPVSQEVFAEHPEAAFWVGKISMLGQVIDADKFDAVTQFRANVYVHQLGFLPLESVDAEGREIDLDDKRSTQFVAIENATDSSDTRVVGSGRLIYKRTAEDALPIEEYFPEVFEANPALENSVEVSRFIARHESRDTQRFISLSVIRAMTFETVAQGATGTYCMIEKPLLRLLSKIGLSITELGEPKEIEELGGVLHPVLLNPPEILEDALHSDDPKFGLLKMMFENDVDNQGLGWFSASLIDGRE